MKPDRNAIRAWNASLPEATRERLALTVKKIVAAKERGRKVAVVTGSGPNVHEGVTTLLAEMMHKGLVDGIITSSAVIAHEMAGTLDRVRRIPAAGGAVEAVDAALLPRGGTFETTVLSSRERALLRGEVEDRWDLYDRLAAAGGSVILKAAGNMAWPMGLRTEILAREAEVLAKQAATTVEHIAGFGADPRTMIGAGARRGLPVIVSVPQLVGGGEVGLAIGDAISITRRSQIVAGILGSADVIVESAVALTQEIHDGPFELYTGHGIWSAWRGRPVYSLEGKTLARIDLDPNLELAWLQERDSAKIQGAVDLGLPKTKLTGMAFRMEMSGFARLEGSIPLTGDIGRIWPCLAMGLEEGLGVELDFISAPQETPEGRGMRDWIADEIEFVDRGLMVEGARALLANASLPRPAALGPVLTGS